MRVQNFCLLGVGCFCRPRARAAIGAGSSLLEEPGHCARRQLRR